MAVSNVFRRNKVLLIDFHSVFIIDFHSVFNALETMNTGFYRDETHIISSRIISWPWHLFCWCVNLFNENESPIQNDLIYYHSLIKREILLWERLDSWALNAFALPHHLIPRAWHGHLWQLGAPICAPKSWPTTNIRQQLLLSVAACILPLKPAAAAAAAAGKRQQGPFSLFQLGIGARASAYVAQGWRAAARAFFF